MLHYVGCKKIDMEARNGLYIFSILKHVSMETYKSSFLYVFKMENVFQAGELL